MTRDSARWRGDSNVIGNAILDVAPAGWRRLDLSCLVLPDVEEFRLTAVLPDGGRVDIEVPEDVPDAARRMRAAYHEPDDGTWFAMRYMVNPPSSVRMAFNLDWDPELDVDPAVWARELAEFPRRPANIPAWLRTRLAEAGQPAPGLPANPPPAPLWPEDLNWYWTRIGNLVALNAPVDWAEMSLTYRAIGDHTEPVLTVEPVSDVDRYVWTPPAEVVELLAGLRAGMYRPGRGTWFEATARIQLDARADSRYVWDGEPAFAAGLPVADCARELIKYPRDAERVPAWLAEAVDPAKALAAAEQAAVTLAVPSARYRIGTIADGAWCLTPDGDGWSVFQAVGDFRRDKATFATAIEAARYFVGHLYLNHATFGDELPPDAKRPTKDWPIQPLGGDRSLSYYEGKRLVVLPPGTEMDHYGDPAGNTLYAARTEFPHRSEKNDGECRVYRLRRSVRAIVGTVIAWHDQPGGGTAYVLERPVADLLAEDALERIDKATTSPR